MAGRKPKPTSRLKLHGTFRTDRRYKSEPVPDVVIPQRPRFLKGEAKKEWNRLASKLAKQRCLTDWDRAVFATYCQHWAEFVDITRKLSKEKEERYTVKTVGNNDVLNPLLSARNRAFQNMLKAAVEFGLSPSSRTRIATNPEQERRDPFAALMNRKANAG